jgi:serine/threonine protein kinase
MGEVWRAHDTVADRVVAIKTPPAHYSDHATFQQRFRRKAQATAKLNSPHVIPIHNHGEIDGRLSVYMWLIEGRDLHALLTDGPMGRAMLGAKPASTSDSKSATRPPHLLFGTAYHVASKPD